MGVEVPVIEPNVILRIPREPNGGSPGVLGTDIGVVEPAPDELYTLSRAPARLTHDKAPLPLYGLLTALLLPSCARDGEEEIRWRPWRSFARPFSFAGRSIGMASECWMERAGASKIMSGKGLDMAAMCIVLMSPIECGVLVSSLLQELRRSLTRKRRGSYCYRASVAIQRAWSSPKCASARCGSQMAG